MAPLTIVHACLPACLVLRVGCSTIQWLSKPPTNNGVVGGAKKLGFVDPLASTTLSVSPSRRRSSRNPCGAWLEVLCGESFAGSALVRVARTDAARALSRRRTARLASCSMRVWWWGCGQGALHKGRVADEFTGRLYVKPPEPRARDGVGPAKARRARVALPVAARPARHQSPGPGAPPLPRPRPALPHAFPSEATKPGNRKSPSVATDPCPASPSTDPCPLMPSPFARSEGMRCAHTHMHAHRGPHEAPCPLARLVPEW
eukprot:scaffold479_cov376-Prasinococcus_capsulatus_cf.AAC.17